MEEEKQKELYLFHQIVYTAPNPRWTPWNFMNIREFELLMVCWRWGKDLGSDGKCHLRRFSMDPNWRRGFCGLNLLALVEGVLDS